MEVSNRWREAYNTVPEMWEREMIIRKRDKIRSGLEPH